MLQVRVKCSENDRMETTVLPAGHHYIPVELDEVVFFVRKGHILPIAKGGEPIQNVASVDFTDLRCLLTLPMVPPMSITPTTARRKITISRSILYISRWTRMETRRAIALMSRLKNA